jgi:phage-related protein
MIAVSDVMIKMVRESLIQAASYPDGIIPIKGMGSHYCSLQELQDDPFYRQLFAVDVDGRQVFVYFKVVAR